MRIYRSLDASPTLFGVSVGFYAYILAGALAALVLGLVAGALTRAAVGIAVFALCVVAVYLYVRFRVQATRTERMFRRQMAARSLPWLVKMPPKPLTSYVDRRHISDIPSLSGRR